MMAESLRRARLLWLLGDWSALARLPMSASDSAVLEDTEIFLYRLQALAVSGAVRDIRMLVAELRVAGVSRGVLAAALVSGAHSIVARAHLASGRIDAARRYMVAAISFGPEAGDPDLLVNLRLMQEVRTILARNVTSPHFTTVASDLLLEDLGELAPRDPFITLALAEKAQSRGEFPNAIRYWQGLAALYGETMPQPYYDRLAAAYAVLSKYPQGAEVEEVRRGSVEKYLALKRAHQILQPELYLEIGVESGRSLRLARRRAIGVDPMPRLNAPLPPLATICRMGSDSFFRDEAESLLRIAPGLVFIDGMHLFEFALRDFMNVEAFSDANTVVIIDDIFPNHPSQASRDRRTSTWTGDVWKIHDVLRQYRPDLRLIEIDVLPTGLLLVHGLEKSNKTLPLAYEDIVAAYRSRNDVPDHYIHRSHVSINSMEALEGALRELKPVV